MRESLPHVPPHILERDMTLDSVFADEREARRRMIRAIAARTLSVVVGAGVGITLALAILMWFDHLQSLP